jgi:fused signal recognition particle receptor
MVRAMDPSATQDLVAVLAAVGGVVAAGGAAVLIARRAAASRRRQIESADAPRGRVEAPRRTVELDEADADAVTSEAGGALPAPDVGARPPAVTPPLPERPGAQILPFPRPGAPDSVQLPLDKPTVPTAARVKKKDAAALVPGLAKTRAGWVARLGQIFTGRKEIDPGLVDEMEKVLLTADIGVRTSQKLLEDIKRSLSKHELGNPEAIWAFLRQRCRDILSFEAPPLNLDAARPFVLLVIGVNGSGKTTTIGKLAAQIKGQGKSVLLAAGDTFRAAATEQLEVWGKRVDAPVVRGKEGADPSSVIFDGVKRAQSERMDVVIADTAGRLHTKTELMQELQKVRRVVGKAAEGAPHETWLVIDATSGQNAIAQAQIFTQAMSVSGIVLTKLDGTAKGGVILGIADQLGIPVRYIGVGERVEDLREFDPEEFVEALFEGQNSPASAA